MSRNLPGGLIELGGEPHIRVSTTDDDGTNVWVSTSLYGHTSDADRDAIAQGTGWYPARHDFIMSDFAEAI